MTNHGKIHNCVVDLMKRGEWLETYKQEDGRTYFHCSPFWILYHSNLFPFKKKTEIKIERQSPCSHCTSIRPKIQWNWFTQHFHLPSWWVPHWVNSWKGIRVALPCVTAGRPRKVCPQRLDALGVLISLMESKRSSTEGRNCQSSALEVEDLLHPWVTLEGWRLDEGGKSRILL